MDVTVGSAAEAEAFFAMVHCMHSGTLPDLGGLLAAGGRKQGKCANSPWDVDMVRLAKMGEEDPLYSQCECGA